MLGKYDSERDSILHALCLADWGNESFGNSTEYGLYVWRIELEANDVSVNNGEFNSLLESLGIESEFRNQLVGCFLVFENSSGQITVIRYDSWFEAQQIYKLYEDDFNEWLDDYSEWLEATGDAGSDD